MSQIIKLWLLMKKMKLLNVLELAAIILSFTLALSSCSNSDDDDNTPNTNNGIHKIEISMSDNAKDYSAKIVFNAFKKGNESYATIFDAEGNQYLPIYDVDYKGGTITATTEKNCFEFAASIMFSNMSMKAGSITINAKSYIDGKLVVSDSRTITLRDGDISKAAYFNSQTGFTDL